MEDIPLASYLRYHRKHTGLRQEDLGEIIGFLTKDQICRYERGELLPSLLVALGYEAVFCVPIADLFPGISGSVKQGIEDRLAELEARLQQSTSEGHKAHATARTLEWLTERRLRTSCR